MSPRTFTTEHSNTFGTFHHIQNLSPPTQHFTTNIHHRTFHHILNLSPHSEPFTTFQAESLQQAVPRGGGTHRVDSLVLGEAHRGDAVNSHGQDGDEQVDERDPVSEERPAERSYPHMQHTHTHKCTHTQNQTDGGQMQVNSGPASLAKLPSETY